jgi:hypothetical protein
MLTRRMARIARYRPAARAGSTDPRAIEMTDPKLAFPLPEDALREPAGVTASSGSRSSARF